MVKDLWEFLDEKVKARIIFGSILALIIVVLIVPYLISVMNGDQSYPEMSTTITDPVRPASTDTSKDDTKPSESTEVAESPTTDTEEEPAQASEPETSYTYAYTPTNNSSTPQPTSQSAVVAVQEEPVRGTTVDDRGSSDDGYTASGIDDPGSNATVPEEVPTEAPTDSSEN